MRESPLFIKNAVLVPGDGTPPRPGALLITFSERGATVAACGEISPPDDCRTLDAGGLFLFPAFTDIGCRLYDPAFPARESLDSGSAAAVAGGFSTVVCEPPESGKPLTEEELAGSVCHILPALPFTEVKKSTEKRIYSDGGKWIRDAGLMRDLLLSCKKSDSLFLTSPIDPSLAGDGIGNPGRVTQRMRNAGIPPSAETSALARDLILALETGCRLHVKTVSLAASVEMIKAAKRAGARVSCGTSPLYFSFVDDDLVYYGSPAKVLPPLRGEEDVEAIKRAILDGTIDCVSSLHCPYTRGEKGDDLKKAPFGASGLDTVFSAFVTYMIRNGEGSLDLLAKRLALDPAAILGRDASLRVGGPADFLLADPNAELVVSANTMKSRATNTPYLGMSLTGVVRTVFRDGKPVT